MHDDWCSPIAGESRPILHATTYCSTFTGNSSSLCRWHIRSLAFIRSYEYTICPSKQSLYRCISRTRNAARPITILRTSALAFRMTHSLLPIATASESLSIADSLILEQSIRSNLRQRSSNSGSFSSHGSTIHALRMIAACRR